MASPGRVTAAPSLCPCPSLSLGALAWVLGVGVGGPLACPAPPQSPAEVLEVLAPPRWCGGVRAGRRADSRQFAGAVPADVYSQPREEGGSHLYSAGGRRPSCHPSDRTGHQAERRAPHGSPLSWCQAAE